MARLACGYDSRHSASREEAEDVLTDAEEFIVLAKHQLEEELKRLALPNMRMGRPGEPDANT